MKKQPKHKTRIMHCGICGIDDHNSRSHTKNQVVLLKVLLLKFLLQPLNKLPRLLLQPTICRLLLDGGLYFNIH
ncbi:hypothetical protein IGI04_015381 [Brassica rapa subsp. trilocularis]|uniref:Uncharacterized protein n=1 Tax=Brassica rapa subsp. trilocularis TaxID=1813537 RepID=A0ABQ7MPW4_BRACM|nr:hypothetical protein IGI04_015381 [Brassica rapa subsp. trilocularis]